MLVSCYIDDCIFVAASKEELEQNVDYAVQFFDRLGLTVHMDKSCLSPTQKLELLGFIINSVDMTVKLSPRKQVKIKQLEIETVALGAYLHS